MATEPSCTPSMGIGTTNNNNSLSIDIQSSFTNADKQHYYSSPASRQLARQTKRYLPKAYVFALQVLTRGARIALHLSGADGYEYRWMERYAEHIRRALFMVDNRLYIKAASNANGVDMELVKDEEVWDLVAQAHVRMGHAGAEEVERELRGRWYVIGHREIKKILGYCWVCHEGGHQEVGTSSRLGFLRSDDADC